LFLESFCGNPLPQKEVISLKITTFRKWSIVIAALTLLVAILRLLAEIGLF